MSVLKNLENRIAGLVEGSFSRAFRSEVRPVEIARRLAKEMDENRTAFVSRVYVPTGYTVYLSDPDYERFAEHQAELVAELCAYLLEHARRENLVLSERPRVRIEQDSRLGLGEFGIRTAPVDRSALSEQKPDAADNRGRRSEPAPRPTAAPAAPPVAAPPRLTPPPVAAPVPPIRTIPTPEPQPGPAPVPAPESAALVTGGHRIDLEPQGIVFGRSRSCDVVLEDPNASRQHARVSTVSGRWVVEDLGSTNGVSVNGRRLSAPQTLNAGDRVEMGHTEFRFEAS